MRWDRVATSQSVQDNYLRMPMGCRIARHSHQRPPPRSPVAQVIGPVLHLLGVCVEVVPAHRHSDEEVGVLDVVDVHVPRVLPGGQAQGAEDSCVVSAL